jgi:inner membrane protein
VRETTRNEKTGVETTRVVDYARQQLLLPEELSITAQTGVQTRYRGIYQARVYDVGGKVSGRFVLPPRAGLPADTDRTRYFISSRPHLAVGISDVRGIRRSPLLRWGEAQVAFVEGTGVDFLPNGIRAPLGALPASGEVAFEFQLDLLGTDRWQLVPLGRSTTVDLASSWPHPSFFGEFLPRSHSVDAAGFRARWQTSHLATGMSARMERAQAGGPSGAQALARFGVAFVEPVNIYLKAERAVKYGILFVILTFVAFFLFELLEALPIHPFQYGLVGLALAVFFLLLIGLSEHLSFLSAYLSASAACIALQGFYLSHVLRSAARGAGFAAALALLYGFMYLLLQSEDFAFLLGSLLVFVALAAVMFATRKVDWYALPDRSRSAQA